MLKDARRGKFQVLVVWALDRFGRSMVGNLRDVLELDRLGVQVVSVRESWLDTGSPVRTLLIAIFSWVAEQERSRLIERTKAGVAAARRRGARLGRPRAPEFVPGVCRKLACQAEHPEPNAPLANANIVLRAPRSSGRFSNSHTDALEDRPRENKPRRTLRSVCGTKSGARVDHDRLQELRAQGWSVRKIAETLGVGSSTVQRRLLAPEAGR
jgi:DNA invertase Pin-like site-specific DNA recombinase